MRIFDNPHQGLLPFRSLHFGCDAGYDDGFIFGRKRVWQNLGIAHHTKRHPRIVRDVVNLAAIQGAVGLKGIVFIDATQWNAVGLANLVDTRLNPVFTVTEQCHCLLCFDGPVFSRHFSVGP